MGTKKEAGHTPWRFVPEKAPNGVWYVRSEQGRGPEGEGVAVCSIPKLGRSLAEIAEIGNLLAAAPDLLEALEGLARLYDTDEGCRSTPEYIAARAALVKAGGQ